MMYDDGMGGFGYFTLVLFWVVLISVIVYFIGRTSENTKKLADESLKILRERLAKGDINKEAFEERKRVLQ